MKIQVLDINGNKSKEIASEIFDGNIREDIVQKIAEIERLAEKQPYAPFYLSGLQTTASGNVKHNRHVWKTDRGRGMSRFPKKRMSDKGSQFVWVAAVAPGTRGGRRAHPPEILRKDAKINRKEMKLGMLSAIAMISSPEAVKKKYSSLEGKKFELKLPLVVESKVTSLKAKEFFSFLEKILGELKEIAVQSAEIRPGIGKLRGRKYKKNAGMIIITGNKENMKMNSFEIKKAKDLKVKDLALNGARLAMFTEEAVKDLEAKIIGKSKEKNK